jgi:hypothetical protein
LASSATIGRFSPKGPTLAAKSEQIKNNRWRDPAGALFPRAAPLLAEPHSVRMLKKLGMEEWSARLAEAKKRATPSLR